MSAEQITGEQLWWEYIKYRIRNFFIWFSKENTKKACAKIVTLENK